MSRSAWRGTLGAAALVAAGWTTPAAAQQEAVQPRLNWAAEEVFQALNLNRGTETYYDAMEAATDELRRYGLIPAQVERFYDRRESRADWGRDAGFTATAMRLHEQVMDVLRRNRGTAGYYQAMEAAADELEGEEMVSDATEEFFDDMAARAGWGGYGYWRGGNPYYGGYAWR